MLNRINKDFITILLGKFLQVIIIILTIKVTTVILTPIELGSMYLFTAFYTFFILSLISPIGHYINRNTHKWEKSRNLIDNLFLHFLYVTTIGLVSIVISTILYEFFGIANGFDLQFLIILMFLFVVFITTNQTIIPMLNMLHMRISFTIFTVLTYLFILIFGYLFCYFYGYNVQNWLLGMVLSNSVFAILAFLYLKKSIFEQFKGIYINLNRINKYSIKKVALFALPLSIATFFMWLQNSGYRFIIEQKIGLEFLGYLGVGLAISLQIASIFESILMQYFQPIYYKSITDTKKEDRVIAVNKLINTILPMYILLTLFISFNAKEIIYILVDEKYYGVFIFTIFGIWIELFRMTTNLVGVIAQSEYYTKKFAFPYVIGSIITCIAVYVNSSLDHVNILLPSTLLIGSFITFILMYMAMKRLLDFSIDKKNVVICFLLSLPYVPFYFLKLNFLNSFLNSFVFLSIATIYLVLSIYLVYKIIRKKGFI